MATDGPLRVSYDHRTGKPVAAYLRVRPLPTEGRVIRTADAAVASVGSLGNAGECLLDFAGASGLLVGIEFLGPPEFLEALAAQLGGRQ